MISWSGMDKVGKWWKTKALAPRVTNHEGMSDVSSVIESGYNRIT